MKYQESKLQQSCVRLFDYLYPKLKLNLFAIPNERKADLKTTQRGKTYSPHGARMKAQGRRRGVSDLFLAIPQKPSPCIIPFNGMFIEFKTDHSKQTVEQIEFEKAVTAQGYRYVVIRSSEDFQKTIEEYLK